MQKKLFNVILTVVIVGVFAAGFLKQPTEPEFDWGPAEPVIPNWASIATWPAEDARATVEATPDPNRRITAIVLDDSGSMSDDIEDAKVAVLAALGAMQEADRVALVALNAGVVLPFVTVAAAHEQLSAPLAALEANGSTPLTNAVHQAQLLLEREARAARSFGTYRIIVTTDGAADDGAALQRKIESLAAQTPIQLATIGIGINGEHVLRRVDLGRFVDVADVSALQSALEAAVAENTDFAAIIDFDTQD